MESSEAFEHGTEIAEGEDPFAGSDFGDWEQPEQVSEVRPPQTTYSDAPPLAVERIEQESPQIAETPPPAPAEPVQPPPEQAPVAAQEAPSVPPTPAPDTQITLEPQTAAESVAETVEAPQPQPEPEPDGDDDDLTDDDEGPDEEPDLAAADNGDAPVPVETKDKAGRTTKRRYILLRVDGNDKFSRLYWHEDKDGNVVPGRTQGAKRQSVVLAKDADDAIKFGFLAAGAPPKGIALVPVAFANFAPRTVAPIPPEPTKIRLRIS